MVSYLAGVSPEQTLDQIHENLNGWTLSPLWTQDRALGGVLANKGTEIHVVVHPSHRHRVIRRHYARAVLAPLLAQHGYLTTRLFAGEDATFVERFGFTYTWSDGVFDYYLLSTLPFGGTDGK